MIKNVCKVTLLRLLVSDDILYSNYISNLFLFSLAAQWWNDGVASFFINILVGFLYWIIEWPPFLLPAKAAIHGSHIAASYHD